MDAPPGGEIPPAFVRRIATLLSADARAAPGAGKRGEPDTAGARLQEPDPALARVRSKQEIRFARAADGTRVAFATTGSGYPLVNAAHWLGHLEFDLQTPVWLPWIERLSARYRLTRYDSRGCGLSDRERFDASASRTWWRISKPSSMPRDSSASLCWQNRRAARFRSRMPRGIPERVSHLVLCGAFARGGFGRHPGLRERAAIEALIQLIKVGWGESNSAFRQLFTNLFFPQATPEQMLAFNAIQRKSTSPAHAARLLRAFSKVDASSYLGQISCPTLVHSLPWRCSDSARRGTFPRLLDRRRPV